MPSQALQPRGKKTERVELVAELEIGLAITVRAEQIAGVRPGEDVPAGFRAQAARELLVAGANTLRVSEYANERADEIRRAAPQD